MKAYYNEIDPFAAQWLRNLIAAGHIAPGDVDERSIEDVRPDEIAGYTQCHFFAGIGGWSLALRYAGWPDDRPVWTGSCPCQPFSAAGKGAGFNDERHLWPTFQWLIQQCQPATVFGEQVASKAVDAWIDLVHADMEAMGYAFGSIPFPSAGVGAPHIRDRNYWVADTDKQQRHGSRDAGPQGRAESAISVPTRGMANPDSRQQPGKPIIQGVERDRQDTGRAQGIGEPQSCGDVCGLANTSGKGLSERVSNGRIQRQAGFAPEGQTVKLSCDTLDACPTNGFWRDADWLFCRDGKWRPVEPGTQPLAHGLPNRVGRLRGYGNAVNPIQAAEFIGAFMECRP